MLEGEALKKRIIELEEIQRVELKGILDAGRISQEEYLFEAEALDEPADIPIKEHKASCDKSKASKKRKRNLAYILPRTLIMLSKVLLIGIRFAYPFSNHIWPPIRCARGSAP